MASCRSTTSTSHSARTARQASVTERRGIRLTVQTRRRIAELYWEYGLDQRVVAQRLGVSPNTVRTWADRWRHEGDAGLQDRPYPKRRREPARLSAEVEQAILAMHAEDPGMSLTVIAEAVTPLAHPDNGRAVGWAAVDRCLERHGIKRVKRLHKLPEHIKTEMVRLHGEGMNPHQIAREVSPLVYPGGEMAVSSDTARRALER